MFNVLEIMLIRKSIISFNETNIQIFQNKIKRQSSLRKNVSYGLHKINKWEKNHEYIETLTKIMPAFKGDKKLGNWITHNSIKYFFEKYGHILRIKLLILYFQLLKDHFIFLEWTLGFWKVFFVFFLFFFNWSFNDCYCLN